MKKGKYYLNWGFVNPDVSRSLSLFLKGTCTFTAWAILCIAATVVSSDGSVFLFYQVKELKCCSFILVMSEWSMYQNLSDLYYRCTSFVI